MRGKIVLIAVALMLVSAVAVAQNPKGDLVDTRTGPIDFRFGAGAGAVCQTVPVGIPDNNAAGVTSTLSVNDNCGAISDLDFATDTAHTWVGDLKFVLTKQGGPSGVVIDRPGFAGAGFGCSGDDIDASLNDEAASPVEAQCAAGAPTIQGDFIPGDPAGPVLANFDGEEFCGLWDLTVSDHAGGDLGTVFEWCLTSEGGSTDGGTDGGDDIVPASNNIGMFLMLILLVGSSVFFMRRRAMNS